MTVGPFRRPDGFVEWAEKHGLPADWLKDPEGEVVLFGRGSVYDETRRRSRGHIESLGGFDGAVCGVGLSGRWVQPTVDFVVNGTDDGMAGFPWRCPGVVALSADDLGAPHVRLRFQVEPPGVVLDEETES